MPEFDVTMKKTIVVRVTAVDPDDAWVKASAPEFNTDGAWERAEPQFGEVEDAE